MARMPPRLTLSVQPCVSKSGPRSVTRSVASRRAPPGPRRCAWTSDDEGGLLRLTITTISWPGDRPTVTERSRQHVVTSHDRFDHLAAFQENDELHASTA